MPPQGRIDCAAARRHLAEIRANRSSQSPESLSRAARTLGYEIQRSRGKGSHLFAVKHGAPRFPIPTNRNPVAVGTTTRILTILEGVLDDVCAG